MKRSSEAQTIRALEESEAGAGTKEPCRRRSSTERALVFDAGRRPIRAGPRRSRSTSARWVIPPLGK